MRPAVGGNKRNDEMFSGELPFARRAYAKSVPRGDIVNRKQRRAGSRCPPPREGLISRADAALILRRDRRSTFRYEKAELLVAVYIDEDGNKWFEQESVVQLAVRFALEGRAGHASSGRQTTAPPTPAPQPKEGDYHPELPSRHASQPKEGDYRPELPSRRAALRETPEPTDKVPPPAAPPQRSTSRAEEKPLPPSVQGAVAIRPTTLVDPTWFNDDFQAGGSK